jgi:ubiquinone/menaquinone biosynthesis C-methylase UbiE
VQYPEQGGIPVLLSSDRSLRVEGDINAAYDEIYSHHGGVWEDQGRTPEFIAYFSKLAAGLSSGPLLEIGCGEGILFRELKAADKTAIDVSVTALTRAKEGSSANFSAAFAESLPFSDGRFDIVVSVGVMEHFVDDARATKEIHRVLRPGGHYIALIHTGRNSAEKLTQKLREYVFPPRPIALARWIKKKLVRPIHQPVQRDYTVESGKQCIERAGLPVTRLISVATEKNVPLIGPHVVIYVARKPA